MYKKINFVFCCILLLAAFLPQGRGMAAGSSITVATDSINVRGGPGLSYPLVKQAKRGETYSVVSEKDDWIEIQLSFGRTGWVVNWLVTKDSEKKASASSGPQTINGATAVATTDQLRIRSGPGTSFQIVGFLNEGQAVSILDQNEYWYKISSSFGDGWVVKDFIKTKNVVEKSQNSDSSSPSTGVVMGDTLNVRENPSTSSTIIGKLTDGTSVVILKQQTNWLQISYGNLQGWVSSEFIGNDSSLNSSKQPSTNDTGTLGTVTTNSLNVRSGSALSDPIIGSVSQGQQFTIVEEKNNWVKIEFQKGNFGWVAGWFLSKSAEKSQSPKTSTENTVTILHNGTNIRIGPNVQTDVLAHADEGETFSVQSIANDWYKIKLKNGKTGYVAGWIVSNNGSAPQIQKSGVEGYLKGKTIVLDPGHGGNDNGTTGANGSLEKELTLRTAKLLYDKLAASGAKVYLTRNNDSYIPLPSRVSTAHAYNADAFISIHYDSNIDASVRGSTGFYYHSYQKELAETVYASTIGQIGLKNRGVRFGDFHVIRENSQKAMLIELGYLSNPQEEATIKTGLYQENAAAGLYNGLARFFKNQ